MRKRRLWWQLFVAYLWVPVAALLSIGLYGSHVVRQLYLDRMEGDLEARARLCGKLLDGLPTRGHTAQIDPLCKELGRASGARITVVLPSGQVVGDSDEAVDALVFPIGAQDGAEVVSARKAAGVSVEIEL